MKLYIYWFFLVIIVVVDVFLKSVVGFLFVFFWRVACWSVRPAACSLSSTPLASVSPRVCAVWVCWVWEFYGRCCARVCLYGSIFAQTMFFGVLSRVCITVYIWSIIGDRALYFLWSTKWLLIVCMLFTIYLTLNQCSLYLCVLLVVTQAACPPPWAAWRHWHAWTWPPTVWQVRGGRRMCVRLSVRQSHLMFLLVLVFLACAVGGLLNGVCQFMSLCVSIVKLLLLFMAAVLSIFSIFAF